MADYLYYTPIYTDTTGVSGVPVNNTANKTDYETNYQGDTGKVDTVNVAATTFYFPTLYADFKDLIADPLAWSDVKELTMPNRYMLYIISNTEL